MNPLKNINCYWIIVYIPIYFWIETGKRKMNYTRRINRNKVERGARKIRGSIRKYLTNLEIINVDVVLQLMTKYKDYFHFSKDSCNDYDNAIINDENL